MCKQVHIYLHVCACSCMRVSESVSIVPTSCASRVEKCSTQIFKAWLLNRWNLALSKQSSASTDSLRLNIHVTIDLFSWHYHCRQLARATRWNWVGVFCLPRGEKKYLCSGNVCNSNLIGFSLATLIQQVKLCNHCLQQHSFQLVTPVSHGHMHRSSCQTAPLNPLE